MFSAGIHAALVPEHLQEMPGLGWSFIGAAHGVALAYALVAKPEDHLFTRLAAVYWPLWSWRSPVRQRPGVGLSCAGLAAGHGQMKMV